MSNKLYSMSMGFTFTMVMITVVTTAIMIGAGGVLEKVLVLVGSLTFPMWISGLITYGVMAPMYDHLPLYKDRNLFLAFALIIFIMLYMIFTLVYRQLIYIPTFG